MDGSELRERREKLGLTQELLGDIFGIHRNTVARMERGDLRVRWPGLMDLGLLYLERHGYMAALRRRELGRASISLPADLQDSHEDRA